MSGPAPIVMFLGTLGGKEVNQQQAEKAIEVAKRKGLRVSFTRGDEPFDPLNPASDTGGLEAAARGMVEGALWGTDKLSAYIGGKLFPGAPQAKSRGLSDEPAEIMSREEKAASAAAHHEAEQQKAADTNPWAFYPGAVAGGIVGSAPLLPAGGAAAASMRAGNLARGAAGGLTAGQKIALATRLGAAEGGLRGATEGAADAIADKDVDPDVNIADRAVAQGSTGAALGGVAGGVLGGVGALGGKLRQLVRKDNPGITMLDRSQPGSGTTALSPYGLRRPPKGEELAKETAAEAVDSGGAATTGTLSPGGKLNDQLARAVEAKVHLDAEASARVAAAEKQAFFATPEGQQKHSVQPAVDALKEVIKRFDVPGAKDLPGDIMPILRKARKGLLEMSEDPAAVAAIAEAKEAEEVARRGLEYATQTGDEGSANMFRKMLLEAMERSSAAPPASVPVGARRMTAAEFDQVLGQVDRVANSPLELGASPAAAQRVASALRKARARIWGEDSPYTQMKGRHNQKLLEQDRRWHHTGVKKRDASAVGTEAATEGVAKKLAGAAKYGDPAADETRRVVEEIVREMDATTGQERQHLLRLAGLPESQQPAWFTQSMDMFGRRSGPGRAAPFEDLARQSQGTLAFETLRGGPSLSYRRLIESGAGVLDASLFSLIDSLGQPGTLTQTVGGVLPPVQMTLASPSERLLAGQSKLPSAARSFLEGKKEDEEE